MAMEGTFAVLSPSTSCFFHSTSYSGYTLLHFKDIGSANRSSH